MRTGLIIVLIVVAAFTDSCTKKRIAEIPETIRLEVNTPQIYADGLDELHFLVFDENNQPVNSGFEIRVDGNPIAGTVFKTNTSKNFSASARVGNKESAPVSFTASRHEINKFSKKIILEEFAGAWCGFCPLYTYRIDSLASVYNNLIPVTIHSGDGLAYVFEQQMRTRFGISTFPAAYLNRAQAWDQSASMIQAELNKKSKCGLSLNTTISNNQVTVTVKVKFDITTSERLSLVLALLEDSIEYPQSNYYNSSSGNPFYGAGDPILNYRHNHTLRTAATDIFGDQLPVSSQKKNETWEKTFVLGNNGYNLPNTKVVAYLFYTVNDPSRFGVLNAQIVKAGENTGFD